MPHKLNTEQRTAYWALVKVRSGAYWVKGHAGTGKTYLATRIILRFLRDGKRVLVLCPTHQAKQQFREKLGRHQERITLATVASFLKQFPIKTETGELKFQWGGFAGSDYDAIVVDEVSMVSEYEFDELSKARDTGPIIFLGDFEQLRPVMKKQGTAHQRLRTFELVKQQRNANRILRLCSLARRYMIFPVKSGEGITVHATREAMVAAFLKQLTTAKRPYEITYLAYRNARVDAVRILAHRVLYGDAPFVNGQYLRLDELSPAGNNGDIVRVVEVECNPHGSIANIRMPVYKLLLANPFMVVKSHVEMVSPEHQRQLKQRLEELYAASGKAFRKNKALWQELQEEIGLIRRVTFYSSPFVQTVHKAQGRSIPIVYVDTDDIATGSDRKRLLYVGYSRAMYRLNTIRRIPYGRH